LYGTLLTKKKRFMTSTPALLLVDVCVGFDVVTTRVVAIAEIVYSPASVAGVGVAFRYRLTLQIILADTLKCKGDD
jgi:hypothetical protein